MRFHKDAEVVVYAFPMSADSIFSVMGTKKTTEMDNGGPRIFGNPARFRFAHLLFEFLAWAGAFVLLAGSAATLYFAFGK